MGGNLEDSDCEPVFEHVVDIEMYADSTSSIFDDSSHSESNNRDEGCDGDDELTDVEGAKLHHPSNHMVIRFRVAKDILGKIEFSKVQIFRKAMVVFYRSTKNICNLG